MTCNRQIKGKFRRTRNVEEGYPYIGHATGNGLLVVPLYLTKGDRGRMLKDTKSPRESQLGEVHSKCNLRL